MFVTLGAGKRRAVVRCRSTEPSSDGRGPAAETCAAVITARDADAAVAPKKRAAGEPAGAPEAGKPPDLIRGLCRAAEPRRQGAIEGRLVDAWCRRHCISPADTGSSSACSFAHRPC